MTSLNEVYKCSVCGNIVEVVHTGRGQLVCCGLPMNLQKENTVEASYEKHIPLVEKEKGKIVVTVGSVIHPMTEEHYIEWIEIIVNGKVYRNYLQPGDEPKAIFAADGDDIKARAYCNIHELWVSS